jgi:uncharacterized protein (TIGR03067 family)
MRIRLLLLGLCVAGVLGCEKGERSGSQPKPFAHDNPFKRLQGEWVAVEGEFKGNWMGGPDAEAFFSQFKVKFDGDAYTFTSPDAISKGTFKVDTSTKPLRMKMQRDGGGEVSAIFELKNDHLFFCATEPGEQAPMEFKTATDSSAVFVVCKRVQ